MNFENEVGYLGYRAGVADVLFPIVNGRYLKGKPILFTTNDRPLGGRMMSAVAGGNGCCVERTCTTTIAHKLCSKQSQTATNF